MAKRKNHGAAVFSYIPKFFTDQELEDVAVHGNYVGQAGHVYWAKNIIGLCEQAKEPELAEDFLELLLSDEMMRRWWLERPRKSGGITIRKDSLVNTLDRNNTEFGQMMGWDDPGACRGTDTRGRSGRGCEKNGD